MNTNIRTASAEDYDSLCTLFDKVDALHRNNLPHIFIKPDGITDEEGRLTGTSRQTSLGQVGYEVSDLNGTTLLVLPM